MTDDIIIPWKNDYIDYLHDESRKIGSADSISFPKSEEEVANIVRAIACDCKITTQGARTGITAGAVPDGGHIINLSRMNAIGDIRQNSSGDFTITVQPGALLADVRKAVAKSALFFPPDPTETSASIGGMAACNASGAMSYFYGPTRRWIESIRMVLADGDIVAIKRGENFASGRSFRLKTQSGRQISGSLPLYNAPDVKSAAGYFVKDNMDMLDFFIGMEGTLGIITEVELKLISQPKTIFGLTVFFGDEETALKFVRIVRGENVEGCTKAGLKPVAIEFFNSSALNLLRKMKSNNPAFANIPALKDHFHTAIYIEFHGDDDEVEQDFMNLLDLICALGLSDEDTWCATNSRELEPLRAFRHATPEAVNLLISERKKTDPEITKLGTDMSVPNKCLEDVINMYNTGLAKNGLESVIFGHIGNNHVHVNIIPKNMDEYNLGKSIYMQWAKKIIDMGGSVSAEHGIGKLKKPFLKLMYGEEGIGQMKKLKQIFDPKMVLNSGNLF